MQEPDETIAGLQRIKFTKPSLYYDTHQKTFDILMYIANGNRQPTPEAIAEELSRRKDGWLNHPRLIDCCQYLADIWTAEMWLPDMQKWADMRFSDTSYYSWAALAAAAKVMHLQARRHAYYAAQELIRDTLSPTGGVDEIEGRIDKLEEL